MKVGVAVGRVVKSVISFVQEKVLQPLIYQKEKQV